MYVSKSDIRLIKSFFREFNTNLQIFISEETGKIERFMTDKKWNIIPVDKFQLIGVIL
jgi:hypothetical protein